MEKTIRLLKYAIMVIAMAALGGGASYYLYQRSHGASAPNTTSGSVQTLLTTSVSGGPLPSSVTVSTSTSSQQNPPHAQKRLWRASLGPVAGFAFTASNVASTTNLYFVERASGNVFDADTANETILRITNTLVPKTYEALFSQNPGIVLLRTIDSDTITTLLGVFATPESTSTFPGALSGPLLPNNIRSIAIDATLKNPKIFYTVTSGNKTEGVLSTLRGANPKQVFISTIGSWRSFLAGGTPIILESPSDGIPGYAYAVSQSGSRSLLIGPVLGLQILPNSTNSALLFSGSDGGQVSLYAKIGTGQPIKLPLSTIAEKCAWAPGKTLIAYCAVPQTIPSSGFLDDWYRGVYHSNDVWWQVNIKDGTTEVLYTPTIPFDVHDPLVDPSGNYLAFTNGNDLSLWVLRIVQ